MNDVTPDGPTPFDAARVPDSPVVEIEIFGTTVSVNGVVIVHDGTESLHHVAVHAAAERVAKVLGRPVRAQATDVDGRATLIVHPDGHATDVAQQEPSTPVVGSVTPAPPPAPASRPVAPVPVVAAVRAGSAPGQTSRPRSGAPSGWTSRVVRTTAVAAALVAVVGMSVLLLTRGADSNDAARGRTPAATPEPSTVAAPADPSDVSVPMQLPTPSTSANAGGPSLGVTPLAGVETLQLTIVTDTVPALAAVTVSPVGKPVIRRTVALDETTTEIKVRNLPGGATTWSVEVDGAATQQGQAVVVPAYEPPAPTPTAPPVGTAPAAPVTTTPISPKTQQPAAAPKPQSKSKIRGQSSGSKNKGKTKTVIAP